MATLDSSGYAVSALIWSFTMNLSVRVHLGVAGIRGWTVLGLSALLSGTAASQGVPVAPGRGSYSQRADVYVDPALEHVPGEIIVVLNPGADAGAFLAVAQSRGCIPAEEIPRFRMLRLRCLDGEEQTMCNVLRRHKDVRLVAPNGYGRVAQQGLPTDPCYEDQWHLSNGVIGGAGVPIDLGLMDAWSITQGSANVIVAVLDTGIQFAHPEFLGRLLPGADTFYNDPSPESTNPHGVHITSLIAGVANNGHAGLGLDQRCQILPVKVVSEGGIGTDFSLSKGIDFAISQDADVMNMSLANFSSVLDVALEAASESGCILVAAAGNSGKNDADKSWPGASKFTISVGATDFLDSKPNWSGTGKALDFMAPGVDVLGAAPLNGQPECLLKFGTSPACALVSGTASLLLSIRPDLTQAQVYALLAESAVDQIGPPSDDLPGWDDKYGYGRVTAGKAVKALSRLLSISGSNGVPQVIDAEKGGHQCVVSHVDPSLRGSVWIGAGSISGSSPGALLGHTVIPLNMDRYFVQTISGAGSISPSSGIVPDDGIIVQSVSIPAHWVSSQAPIVMQHLVIVIHSPLVVSEPVQLAVE